MAGGMPLFPAVYAAAIRALAAVPARVLVTIGSAGDPAELGPLPANVHVERWVPQEDVLPHAAAMVGHGGYGTTTGALAHGVPMVVVPLFADQPRNALRVADVGAGIALPAPANVRAAVEHAAEALAGLGGLVQQLLDQPRYTALPGTWPSRRERCRPWTRPRTCLRRSPGGGSANICGGRAARAAA